MQKGTISVQTENIFPIIKQFLYSDQEIFLRELIANAVDATNKLRTLTRRGEAEVDMSDERIEVMLDKEAGTLTILDKGIGMTEEEVKKYLNQVAFSSAKEFLEKYQDDASVIGHFGLGFYSAFMVAKKVNVRTKSYKDAPAVEWSCTGDPEYTLEEIEKEQHGTEIILHLSDDSKEYLEESRIQGLLDKYCKFLPVEIQFGTQTESYEVEVEGETDEEGNPKMETKTREVANIINNPDPSWRKNPSELEEQDYIDFYNELYPFSAPPMFWIHLNIDYPFNLTGILYFPKLGNSIDPQRNKIQLYSNQVYVTDEVKDIVPEFLTLLHGVIDSPDIPLNVSRSYLQSDSNVKKISEYITKKVADKLEELFRKERDNFEDKWENMGVFVKYGMVSDDKFFDKAKKFALLESVNGDYATLEEYREKIKDQQTDKNDTVIYLYTTTPDEHDSLIKKAEDEGYDVLKLDTIIDTHFIQHLERKIEKSSFKRIDADPISKLIDKDEERESVLSEEDEKALTELFKESIDNSSIVVRSEALSPNDMPVLIVKPEFLRRMREMQIMQGGNMDMPESYNVVLNSNHPLMGKVLESKDAQQAQHLYQLALLQQGMLRGSDLTAFVEKSLNMLK